ncbi:periplasmic heavy metal sensor [Pyxidicoccus sp. 3LG]
MTNRISKLLSTTTAAALLLAMPAWAQDEDRNVVVHTNGPDGEVVVHSSGPVMGAMHAGGPGMVHMRALHAPINGIPPHLVEKLNIPRDLAQRIKDLSFESNEALIPLEAELKKAQLRLERLLSAPSPDENGILRQVEEVGRAETAVRRNRVGLMVQVKKLLGPDLWQKLEAELGPVHVEKRVKILRGPPGTEAEPTRPGSPAPRKP